MPARGSSSATSCASPTESSTAASTRALVESLCSYATAVAVHVDGMIAMGQSIEVSFLRPVTSGHAEARAVARHRGRTTWVWQVEILDDDERLCALAKMTMAVRPAPQGRRAENRVLTGFRPVNISRRSGW